MTRRALPARLVLDFIAAGLLLVALAYYWLGNAVHELVGTAIFLLLLAHNVFNRRWYGGVASKRHGVRNAFDAVLVLCLACAALALLASSLLISHFLRRALALDGDTASARQVHLLAAYWIVVLMAIHLGLRWQVVMNIARNALGIVQPNMARTIALRCMAVALAVHGLWSSFAMGVGGSLMLEMRMDWWDFAEGASGFFFHWSSIVGLYASLAHGLSSTMLRWRRHRP